MRSVSNSLGSYLKQKRRAAGLSQKATASALGYSCSQMISNWERGLCHPPLAKLGQITKLYRVKSTALIEIMIRDYERLLQSKVTNNKAVTSKQKIKTRNGLRSDDKSKKLPDAAGQFFIRPTLHQRRTLNRKLALV